MADVAPEVADAVKEIVRFLGYAAPLVLIPWLFKASSSTLGRISGAISSRAQRAQKGATEAYKGTGFAKHRGERREARELENRAREGVNIRRPGTYLNPLRARARRSGAYNVVTGGYGAYEERRVDVARRAIDEKTVRDMANDVSLAENLIQAGGDRAQFEAFLKNRKNSDGKDMTAATAQRMQQFLVSGNFKSGSAVRAAAKTMTDIETISAAKYKRAAELVQQFEGKEARDAFIDEQNAYHLKNGFKNIAFAGYDSNGEFTQYIRKGQTSANDQNSARAAAASVFSSLSLHDTKKEVFDDPTMQTQLKIMASTDTGRSNLLREATRMKDNQLQRLVVPLYENDPRLPVGTIVTKDLENVSGNTAVAKLFQEDLEERRKEMASGR